MREDFENELSSYISNNFTVCNDETLLSGGGVELKSYDIEGVAKYFYELGKNDAEKKIRELRNHLEKNIARMTRSAEVYQNNNDDESRSFVDTLLHDRAVFQGILDVLLKL